MIRDYFVMGIRNLRKRKVRSWLTLIGIFISIATIFMLISLSLGLENAINEQFRLLGTDKVFIQPKGELAGPGSGGAVQLTQADIDAIEDVRGVKKTTFFVFGNAKVEFDDQTRYNQVIGVDLDTLDLYFESVNLKILDGRNLRDGDSNDVVLGYDYAYNEAFDRSVKPGNKITINGEEFRVRGIASKVGNPQDDKMILMPMDKVRELFEIPERVDMIIVQINPDEDVNAAAERIRDKLDRERDVDEKTRDYQLSTPEELLGSFNTVLNIITSFLLGVAAISLIVGGIGIANTMYTSVLERTKEIGVMKAIGAKNQDIRYIFLIESGMLGLLGGAMGVALGMAGAKLIEYIVVYQLDTNLLKIEFSPYLIIGCLAFSFIAGAISGVWPAMQATRIKPVEALRYE